MKKLFNPKKPWLWIVIAVVVAAVMLAVFFLMPKPNTTVSSSLNDCVLSTLRQVHYSSHTEGKYPAVSYVALDVIEDDGATTVYGVMMYREYTRTTQDELVLWVSSHCPFAITATEKADGTYEATDCWWPADGGESNASIRKKFPLSCEKDAINYQQYFADLDATCYADAAAGIADEDEYVVMKSDRDNVWLSYCPNNTYGYITSTGSFSADGTYAVADGTVSFTFGERVAVFTMQGADYIYDDKQSKNIPDAWKSYRNQYFLVDGARFSDESRGETAPVGDTVIVSGGMHWMGDDAIQQMFGYVPNNSHITDATVSSPSDKPYYLPIKVLSTRDQLDQFLVMYGGEGHWKDLKADLFTKFDHAYFEKNSLVVTYYKDGTYQAQPSVAAYAITEDGTCLSVRLHVTVPNLHDTALGQWLLFSGIQKSDMEIIKTLEAYVEKTEKEEDIIYDGTNLSFTGKVKQVEGRSVLMESYDVDQFVQGVWVELGDIDVTPQVGEEYVVTYEDMMMPSLPPRITAISITPKN